LLSVTARYRSSRSSAAFSFHSLPFFRASSTTAAPSCSPAHPGVTLERPRLVVSSPQAAVPAMFNI
jgi:hypothetical protein